MSFWYHVYPRYEENSNDRHWVVQKTDGQKASAIEDTKRKARNRAIDMARGSAHGVILYTSRGKRDDVLRVEADDDVPADVEKPGYPVGTYKWGVGGEGSAENWETFIRKLEIGRVDRVKLSITPDYPDWGEALLPTARSSQKPRGKTIFAHVGMKTEDMWQLQGELGKRWYDTTRRGFMEQVEEERVEEYAERFRQGERPGPFTVFIGPDMTWNHTDQEGRHRIEAAKRAGISKVHTLILFNAGRPPRRTGEEGVDYYTRYD